MGRYDAQLSMPEIGEAGQKALSRKSVLVVGAGGLGSTLLYCLAGAGVGRIGIADNDTVSLPNLNRQFLYCSADIGRPKVDAARQTLLHLNPEICVVTHPVRVDAHNGRRLVEGYDLVLAAVDNLKVRLYLNAACVQAGIPLVNGGVDGMNGQVQTVTPGGPCLACLYRELQEPEEKPASFPPTVSAVSALMAQCGLLLLLGRPNPLDRRLLHCALDTMDFEKIKLAKDPACPVCGKVQKKRR